MPEMKVYDNYPSAGVLGQRVTQRMIDLGADPRHRQFRLFVVGTSKPDVLDLLERAGVVRLRIPDLRISMGNDLEALVAAGVFSAHRAVVAGITGGSKVVIDAITGAHIGDFERVNRALTFTKKGEKP